MNLDKTDKKIIESLRLDSGASLKELSKITKITRITHPLTVSISGYPPPTFESSSPRPSSPYLKEQPKLSWRRTRP